MTLTRQRNVANFDHPLTGLTLTFDPAPIIGRKFLPESDGPGILVVAPKMQVRIVSTFHNWNGVPGLDMAYVFVPSTGLHTHLVPKDFMSRDVMEEARGWLRDCGLPDGGDREMILRKLNRCYEGGVFAFLAAVAVL